VDKTRTAYNIVIRKPEGKTWEGRLFLRWIPKNYKNFYLLKERQLPVYVVAHLFNSGIN
jgi:hypothetical protein